MLLLVSLRARRENKRKRSNGSQAKTVAQFQQSNTMSMEVDWEKNKMFGFFSDQYPTARIGGDIIFAIEELSVLHTNPSF